MLTPQPARRENLPPTLVCLVIPEAYSRLPACRKARQTLAPYPHTPPARRKTLPSYPPTLLHPPARRETHRVDETQILWYLQAVPICASTRRSFELIVLLCHVCRICLPLQSQLLLAPALLVFLIRLQLSLLLLLRLTLYGDLLTATSANLAVQRALGSRQFRHP